MLGGWVRQWIAHAVRIGIGTREHDDADNTNFYNGNHYTNDYDNNIYDTNNYNNTDNANDNDDTNANHYDFDGIADTASERGGDCGAGAEDGMGIVRYGELCGRKRRGSVLDGAEPDEPLDKRQQHGAV